MESRLSDTPQVKTHGLGHPPPRLPALQLEPGGAPVGGETSGVTGSPTRLCRGYTQSSKLGKRLYPWEPLPLALAFSEPPAALPGQPAPLTPHPSSSPLKAPIPLADCLGSFPGPSNHTKTCPGSSTQEVDQALSSPSATLLLAHFPYEDIKAKLSHMPKGTWE